jgi:hypothetical protein
MDDRANNFHPLSNTVQRVTAEGWSAASQSFRTQTASLRCSFLPSGFCCAVSAAARHYKIKDSSALKKLAARPADKEVETGNTIPGRPKKAVPQSHGTLGTEKSGAARQTFVTAQTITQAKGPRSTADLQIVRRPSPEANDSE